MKNKIRRIISCLLVCLCTIGTLTLYAADSPYITEAQFASKLNNSGICKVATQSVTGGSNTLTRERAAELITQYLNYTAIAKRLSSTTGFSDVTSSKGEIQLVSQMGIISGMGNGLFSPNAYVTGASADVIIQRIGDKLNQGTNWKHACYAISSSSQKEWMQDYNAISFGWAQVVQNGNSFEVSTSSEGLKVPDEFETVVDLAKAGGAETYLMIYFEGGEAARSLLTDSANTQTLISQIITLVNGVEKNGVIRSFDGVTIDFEGLASSTLQAPYVNFLTSLKSALKVQNKKLNVAVQPTLYYKGYDYAGIGAVADHVILMAHDYGAKTLNLREQQAGMTTTPLTPIDDVYIALIEAKNAITDSNKIALQFSFASLQWQKQNGTVLNSTAYTPSYDKIIERVAKTGTVVSFDPYYQCTSAAYTENGVSNVIWYEDAKSIKAKMDLAKLLGITNFSYWRLGMIPNEIRSLQ